MSNTPIIQVNYPVLRDNATHFGDLAAREEEVIQRLKSKMHALENGGWEGEGSDAFFSEMQGKILPRLQRLHQALLQTKTTIQKISQEMAIAEEEAKKLLGDETIGAKIPKGLEGSAKKGIRLEDIGVDGLKRPLFFGRQSGPFSFALEDYLRGNKSFKEAISKAASEAPSWRDFAKLKAKGEWELWNLKNTPFFEKNLIDNEFAKVRVSAGELTSSGSAELAFDGKFAASLKGDVGAYAIRSQGSAEYGAFKGSYDAYVGASASGEVTAQFDPRTGKITGKLEGEAFIGAEAKGQINADVGEYAKVGAEGSLTAGIGAQGKVDIGFDNGKFKFDVGGKFALGVGAGGRFTGELDLKKIGSDAVGGIQDLGKKIGFPW